MTIPHLLWFLFPDSPETALLAASPRLLLWCRAYEEWLAERQRTKPTTVMNANSSWGRLLGQANKMPWEISEDDMQAYADWMGTRQYAAPTIAQDLRYAAAFYRWCGEKQIDPECEAGFNPAEKVRQPSKPNYEGQKLLSREEVDRLLGFMQQDATPLGRRNHAFVLVRLHMGVLNARLLNLTWGQIEHDGETAWVRWRPEGERCPLPADVWEAIRVALEAGGRLESMQAEDYIFAPLADMPKAGAGQLAQDWRANRTLTRKQILHSLKTYGHLAGIAEEKLNLHALRRTAIRLRLDETADLDEDTKLHEMRLFVDSQSKTFEKQRPLKGMPPLPPDEQPWGEEKGPQPRPPRHYPRHLHPSEGLKHGFYSRSQPAQAVLALVAENVQGIDEPLRGLRILERHLLERIERAGNSRQNVLLVEAQSLVAARVGEMIRADKELQAGSAPGEFVLRFLQMMENMSVEQGCQPFTEEERAAILASWASMGMDIDPAMSEVARHVSEEVAALRYVLRKTLQLALDAQDTREHTCLVKVYSDGCGRLLRLLKMQVVEGDPAGKYLSNLIDTALEDFWKALEAEAKDPAASPPDPGRLDPR